MRVSMLALLRLAVLAFLLGALLLAGYVALRFLFRLACSFLPRRRETVRPRRGIFRFLNAEAVGDLLYMVLVGGAIAVLLYWQGDGIPRLFVFLSCGLGALSLRALFLRPWQACERHLLAWAHRLAMMLIRPFALAFARIGGVLFSFLMKFSHSMIKRAKRIYTNCVSSHYKRHAPHIERNRRLIGALREAVKEEEHNYEGYRL